MCYVLQYCNAEVFFFFLPVVPYWCEKPYESRQEHSYLRRMKLGAAVAQSVYTVGYGFDDRALIHGR